MTVSRVFDFEHSKAPTVLAYHTPRGEVPEHQHRCCHELLYIAGGSGWCRLGSAWLELEQNQLLLLPAGVRHRVQDHPARPLSVYVLAFKEEALRGVPYAEYLLTPLQSGGRRLQMAEPLLRHIHILMRCLTREAERSEPDWPVASRVYLLETLLLVRRGQDLSPSRLPMDPRVYQIKEQIDEHFAEPLDVEQLSQMVFLSARQMTKLFKRDLGTTVTEYITRVRLDRARSLLHNTRLDITTICFESGFQSVTQFYRAFKEAAGVSPGRYRALQH